MVGVIICDHINNPVLDKWNKSCILLKVKGSLLIKLFGNFAGFLMEVICMETKKKGRKQYGWAGDFECTGKGRNVKGCGAILIVSQIDLYPTSQQSVGDSSSDHFKTFRCPECFVETNVDGVRAKPLGTRLTEKQVEVMIRKAAKTMRSNPQHSQSNKEINILLGSESLHKLDAVRKACERLGMKASVSGIKASSGQNAQPIGYEETFAGALARAKLARNQNPDAIGVGIESGILPLGRPSVFYFDLDIAVVVVLTMDNRWIVTTSAGIAFPWEHVQTAENRGFESTTVGSVIAKGMGGDPADPHSTLTKGQVSRTMTLTDAVVLALSQI